MGEIVQRTHGSLKHAQRTQLLFTSQACGKALVRNLFFKKQGLTAIIPAFADAEITQFTTKT
jgi:hypothetical protein